MLTSSPTCDRMKPKGKISQSSRWIPTTGKYRLLCLTLRIISSPSSKRRRVPRSRQLCKNQPDEIKDVQMIISATRNRSQEVHELDHMALNYIHWKSDPPRESLRTWRRDDVKVHALSDPGILPLVVGTSGITSFQIHKSDLDQFYLVLLL